MREAATVTLRRALPGGVEMPSVDLAINASDFDAAFSKALSETGGKNKEEKKKREAGARGALDWG